MSTTTGLSSGTRLGPYEILSALGEGGMGAVYRARDTRLKRDVAIKVLRPEVAGDPERLARFQREGEVLATLNHPNIAHIHGIEQGSVGDVGLVGPVGPFLVLECVDGPTLANRIASGPIPLDEALPIAKQIADALEAAHEQGIIHRDLKPANIKVKYDGTVKVLDFGLAKASEGAGGIRGAAAGRAALTNSPTITSPALMTGVGVLLGTAAYMSPEQAKGLQSDKRADIWAFGCVLFEMLTGRRAFPGDDVTDTIVSVLSKEPDWTALPRETPAAIRTLLRRCLAKDRRERLGDAGDARLEIRDALKVPAAPVNAARSPLPVWRTALPWTLAIAASLAAVALSVPILKHERETRTNPPVVRLTATPSGNLAFAGLAATSDPDLAIAPDGSRIVYVNISSAGGPARLFVRNLGELDAKPLVASSPRSLRSPFISADSTTVGFFDNTGVMFRIPIDGGTPVVVFTAGRSPAGASWGDDGAIVFATIDRSTGLLRVAAAGGEPEVLTKPDASTGELDHVLPEVLPGSRAVLFTIAPLAADKPPSIAVLDLNTREQKILVAGSHPHYLASGHLLYSAEGTVRAVRFDAARLEITGTPVAVLQGVMTKTGAATASVSAVDAAVSRNGTLTYIAGEARGAMRSVTWVDSSGREEPLGAPVRAYAYARLSPDERRIAFDIRDQQNDIWTWDVARKTMTRLTFDPGLNRGMAWTPDSQRLAFSVQREGGEDLYWQTADGTGTAEQLTDGPGIKVPSAISPDGTRLFFVTPSVAPYDIGMVTLGQEHRVESLLKTPFSEQDPEVSPDGRWLAYWSNESGRDEVFVRPFPNVDTGKWQVSTSGGSAPVWSRDGRWLYYWIGAQGAGQGRVMRISVQRVPNAFASGPPELVIEGPYLRPQTGRPYDVARDGRILVIKDALVAPTTPNQLVVVLNWFEELKRLVPAK